MQEITQEMLSSHLRLDGYSWLYLKNDKGHPVLYHVPLSWKDCSTSIIVFSEDGKTILFEQSFDVDKKEYVAFFNGNIAKINQI